MDIIATRNSFGDFGRVVKGQIIPDLQKSQAEKLIGSGAYRQATGDDHKASQDAKGRRVLNAKDRASAKSGSSVDLAPVLDQVAELREGITTAFEKLAAAIQSGVVEGAKNSSDTASVLSGDIAALNGRFDALEKQLETLKAPPAADGGKK